MARTRMDAALRLLPADTRRAVLATLEYGLMEARAETRSIARNNWHAIQVWGRRLTLLLAAFVVVSGALSVFMVHNTSESEQNTSAIQASRRERLVDTCDKGNAFIVKLKQEIDGLPPGQRRREARSQEQPTIALVRTLVTTTIVVGPGEPTSEQIVRAHLRCVALAAEATHG